jgi:hypothetical protein
LTTMFAGATLELAARPPGTRCGGLAWLPDLWRIPEMAKALLGHVGGPDPRLITEVRRLRRRVHDLEAEVLRLQAENDSLTDAMETGPVLGDVTEPEPALA